jgi:hypothetical protein
MDDGLFRKRVCGEITAFLQPFNGLKILEISLVKEKRTLTAKSASFFMNRFLFYFFNFYEGLAAGRLRIAICAKDPTTPTTRAPRPT